MTKRRKAILIESGSIAVAPPLQGAAQDIKNWMNYLLSPLGGYWNDRSDEIVSMSMPTKDELVEQITTLSCYDYAFITFSGHGGFNTQKGEDFVFLNNRQMYVSDNVRNFNFFIIAIVNKGNLRKINLVVENMF